MMVRLNSKVKVGDKIAEIHANTVAASVLAEKRFLNAIKIKPGKINKAKLIQAVIR